MEEKAQTLLKKEREFVIPGEEIVKSMEYLPGRSCFREGESIVAKRIGVVSVENRVISVIPLNGVYAPSVGDMVIGEVVDIQGNSGWVVNIDSPNEAFLPLAGVREFVSQRADLSKIYSIGDTIYAKIHAMSGSSIYLSMHDVMARKFRDGMVIKMNPMKVPRLIGKQGSMINAIKEKTDARISVGQNGLIWVDRNFDLIKEVVGIIEKECFTEGLTDKVAKFLGEKTKAKTEEKEEKKEE
jgi:exosome complex component RRP4